MEKPEKVFRGVMYTCLPYIGAEMGFTRLIEVVDVVGPTNPYQPIPFHILSFAVFQSRILIYAGSNT